MITEFLHEHVIQVFDVKTLLNLILQITKY
jgi:hypothetical protein